MHGLTDAVATNRARQHIGVNAPMLRVSHWAPNAGTVSIDRVFDTRTALAHRIVALIVPGSWKGEPDAGTNKQLGCWLAERHLAGATLCSVCGGIDASVSHVHHNGGTIDIKH
ncbi:MAG TPA: hypothetical protein VGL35_14520 [Rhizomicrobium sp.]|jgi:putative intracellular protease/amidase